MRAGAWVALACAALAAFAWLAAWQLPWLKVAGAGQSLGRTEFLASQVPYERMLVAWPLLALPVGAGALAAIAWGDRVDPPQRTWVVAAAAIAAFSGTIALVCGSRLMGFAVVRAMDPGGAVVQPGLAAVAVALGGAGALWAARWTLRHHGTAVPLSPMAAVATLLVMPFIPFGRAADGTVFYDELSLAAAANAGGLLAPAAQALGWMRGALWVSVLAGALALAFTNRPTPRLAVWRLAVLAVGPLAAVVLCFVFLARWAAIDGLALCWNASVPLGVLATFALALWPLRAWSRRALAAGVQEAR